MNMSTRKVVTSELRFSESELNIALIEYAIKHSTNKEIKSTAMKAFSICTEKKDVGETIDMTIEIDGDEYSNRENTIEAKIKLTYNR